MIEVPGARLHVEEVGEGPVALVLHGGLGVDHQMYRTLDPFGARLRLVYLDHRANGRSTGEVSTVTMDRLAADAASVAASVSPDEPVIVIGHSYGGFIAQELMISHPECVRGVVLVATTPGQLGTGEEPAADGPPLPAEFADLLASMPETDGELASFMHRMAPAYLHRTPADVLHEAMAPTRFRVAAMARGFEVLADWSSVDRLAGVTLPVLLVVGRHDAFTAWPQSERIAARLPDAELVLLEQSGHLPWLEEPDEFFPAVTDWLERRGLLDPC
jgi:proline iminopeptidase